MRKVTTLTLPAADTNARLLPGQLDTGKGKMCRGLRLKFNVPLIWTAGGTMNDAQKQALLAKFTLSLRYGRGGQHVPLEAQPLTRVAILSRYAYGAAMEGYDSAAGLGKTFAAGVGATASFHLLVPTGMAWMFEAESSLWGMGPSQCRTVQLDLNRLAGNEFGTAGLSINGPVTVDVIPDLVSAGGDRWTWLPEWKQQDETNPEAELSDGLPLLIVERTTNHLATALTNISLFIEEEAIHEQISPLDAISEYHDSPLLPAPASVADRVTVLYAIPNTVRLRDVPTGRPRVRQNVKDLATMALGYWFIPVKSTAVTYDEIENVARTIRQKTLKAVSLPVAEGVSVPERLAPFMPFILFDEDHPAFAAAPGVRAGPQEEPRVVFPQSAIDGARAARARFGDRAGAEAATRHAAALVPGAVQSGRGFGRGHSQTLQQVQALFR